MPEKLLEADYGIPKSTLSEITATKDDVSSGKLFLDINGDIVTGIRTMLGRYKECAFCALKRGEYSYCCIFTEDGIVTGGGGGSTTKKRKISSVEISAKLQ